MLELEACTLSIFTGLRKILFHVTLSGSKSLVTFCLNRIFPSPHSSSSSDPLHRSIFCKASFLYQVLFDLLPATLNIHTCNFLPCLTGQFTAAFTELVLKELRLVSGFILPSCAQARFHEHCFDDLVSDDKHIKHRNPNTAIPELTR